MKKLCGITALFMISCLYFVHAHAQSKYADATGLLLVQPKINKVKTPVLLHLYKTFFSSQDGDACTFYPSCSAFAVMMIKQKGLFAGVCYTTDRLCRCNGNTDALYPVLPNGKLLDLP